MVALDASGLGTPARLFPLSKDGWWWGPGRGQDSSHGGRGLGWLVPMSPSWHHPPAKPYLFLQALTFIIFICFTASISAYMAAALLEFFITLAFLFLYATQYYQRFDRLNWPCLVRNQAHLPLDSGTASSSPSPPVLHLCVLALPHATVPCTQNCAGVHTGFSATGGKRQSLGSTQQGPSTPSQSCPATSLKLLCVGLSLVPPPGGSWVRLLAYLG